MRNRRRQWRANPHDVWYLTIYNTTEHSITIISDVQSKLKVGKPEDHLEYYGYKPYECVAFISPCKPIIVNDTDGILHIAQNED